MIVVMVALIVPVVVPVVFGLVLFLFFRRSRAMGWGRGRRWWCYIRLWLWWRRRSWCGCGDRQTVAADGDINPIAGHCRN